MVNRLRLIYSKAAIARIFNVALSRVKVVQVWWRVCFVIIEGQRPRFVSCQAFLNNFVDWRKQQARELLTNRVKDNFFRVVNPKKATAYSLYAYQDSIDCSCEDYSNQIKFIGKGCCKHGYAVLHHLGFDRLKDYIEHHQWVSNEHSNEYLEDPAYF
ncbi:MULTISPECIES: hypothetical protein [Cyanophyceae]|uniref:hypothetical protein n=1 Tax=Cyanophyceae TaxID=3028117 RepID=UPI001681C787|nr:hypothetical protein [Trichocoleus sp. FACHB-40]MBD2006465.1 hypothetical protein [Trichocoleus sp. FACHB-40]